MASNNHYLGSDHQANSPKLAREFYQITENSSAHDDDHFSCNTQQYQRCRFENFSLNQITHCDECPDKPSRQDLSHTKQSQYDRDQPIDNEKFSHSLNTISSTAISQSRRKYWVEETLRQIEQKQQSQEKSSKRGQSCQSRSLGVKREIVKKRPLKYSKEQNNIKKRYNNPNHKHKPLLKHQSVTNISKNHCVVTLKFPADSLNHKARQYQVGMKDLNHKWFEMLNSIHMQAVKQCPARVKTTNSIRKNEIKWI